MRTVASKAERGVLDDPSVHEAAAVLAAAGSDAQRGLAGAEAARRLAADGANTLRAAPPVPIWRRLVLQLRDPLIYLMLVAVAVSTTAWWIEGRHGWPIDALVIAAIVLANAILGFAQEAKADSAVAALSKLTQANSSVLRDGRLQAIPSRELVVGDILVLAEGDAVGADARIVLASSLRVQEASLTGESEAVLKDAGTLASQASIGDRRCMVFKGTVVVGGSGRAVVSATGMRTQMGSVASLLEQAKEPPTPLQLEIARIGRMLGMAVVAIACLVVATVLAMSEVSTLAALADVLLLGVSLAVAAVPEGLPAILSLVLALGVQRMAARRAIVKKPTSVEALGSASVICSDKTGTLTRSEMTIQRVMTAGGSARVTGVGYAPAGRVEHESGAPPDAAMRAEHIVMLSGGSLAGNAQLREAAPDVWEVQGDPTEAAFLVAERKLGVHERRRARFTRVREIPFSSERRMMSSIELDHEQGDGLVIICKGAPDILLGRCTQYRRGLEVVAMDDAARTRALADVDRLSDDALRTLAVAYRPLRPGEEGEQDESRLERELIFVGTVGIIDPPREEAAVAIREAQRAGIRVLMITGDHPRTAARIAADLGLVEAGAPALSGAQLNALDEQGFAEAVRRCSVFARVEPVHKLRIVGALQAAGEVVAMTGDGVNDAPALKAADIGVAMGITGTEASKQAAKMILADDNFATIVDAVREGRAIFDNIRKFLRYLLSSNMGEVLTVFLGVVGAGLIGLQAGHGESVVLPLLATQILWINLLTDTAPALAMGMEPAADRLMQRRPRRTGERVIDLAMWAEVLQYGLVMALATLLTLDLYLPGGLIEGEQGLDLARTAAFTVLVLAQLFNALNSRSQTRSAFEGLASNPWLLAALLLSLLLQIAVVNLPFLNAAFGTVPLSAGQWAVCAAMASAVLWYAELYKLILRIWHRAKPS